MSPARLVLAALCLALPACGEPATAAREDARAAALEIELGRSRVGAITRTVEVSGTLRPREEVELAVRVAGRVEKVLADVGDRVPPGAELLRLDPTDARLTLEQRATTLQALLARLGLDAVPGEDFDPASAPEVESARLRELNAESRLQRATDLNEQSPWIIAGQDYDDLQTERDVARSEHEVALQEAQALAAEARSRAAELALAQKRLDDTQLRAPQGAPEWALAERLVSIGEEVAASQPVFRLVDDGAIKFRAGVPERYLGQVAPGQAVRLWVEAFDEPFTGKVARISPDVRTESRTFLVEAEVDNADGRLAPGAFARGEIDTRVEEGVTFVPASAVASFAGVTRVFTVADGKAVEHRVETGAERDGEVEILSGFEGEADVVVAGAERLAQGADIVVRQTTVRTGSY